MAPGRAIFQEWFGPSVLQGILHIVLNVEALLVRETCGSYIEALLKVATLRHYLRLSILPAWSGLSRHMTHNSRLTINRHLQHNGIICLVKPM